MNGSCELVVQDSSSLCAEKEEVSFATLQLRAQAVDQARHPLRRAAPSLITTWRPYYRYYSAALARPRLPETPLTEQCLSAMTEASSVLHTKRAPLLLIAFRLLVLSSSL
jgi:hypothetical protein